MRVCCIWSRLYFTVVWYFTVPHLDCTVPHLYCTVLFLQIRISHTFSTPPLLECGDWSEDNIACLKEGLRKFGRAWGKVYREVGGSKTATQCKMFYDDQCGDETLGLQEALLEHSRIKVVCVWRGGGGMCCMHSGYDNSRSSDNFRSNRHVTD